MLDTEEIAIHALLDQTIPNWQQGSQARIMIRLECYGLPYKIGLANGPQARWMIDAQAHALDLTALSAFGAGIGIACRTAANTWALRSLAAGTGISITNPAGTAGDPSISLTPHGLTVDAIPKAAALGAWVASSISDDGTTVTITEKLSVTGSITTSTLAYGSTDNVIIHSTGTLQSRTIDSRIWVGSGVSVIDNGGASLTANYIPYATGAMTLANSIIVQTATGIGIGVSPVTFMHVQKDQNKITQFLLYNATSGATARTQITCQSDSGNAIDLIQYSTDRPQQYGSLTAKGMSTVLTNNINGLLIDNYSNTPMYLATNNAVRMTITAAGLHGIGAYGMDIDTLLHVAESNANAVTSAANTLLSIERNGDAWISILTPAANAGGIYFGSPTSSQRGVIRYDHSTDVLSLCIGSTAETIGIHAGGIYMGDTLYAGFGNSYASPDLKIYSDGSKAKFDCGSWAEFSNRLYCETNKRVACGGGQSGAYTTPIGTVTLQIDDRLYTLPYTSVTTI